MENQHDKYLRNWAYSKYNEIISTLNHLQENEYLSDKEKEKIKKVLQILGGEYDKPRKINS